MILREDDDRQCPPVIREVLVNQNGWKVYDESIPPEQQVPPNLFWKTNRFFPTQISSCVYPYQRVNHYPKSSEITKKEGLYRHMKRMKTVHGSLFSFVPETFSLPNEYVKFCQYFASERERAVSLGLKAPLYIVKPSELSRGRKIFVFDDIGELSYDCASVVQRYIDRPLLIRGHKVDFRIYVLVTSFQPMRAYIYEDFLTRFGGERYSLDVKDTFVHLTNYSVTKTSTSTTLLKNGVENCKWDGPRTRKHFANAGIDFSVVWGRIETVVRCTLLSICHLVPPIPQCFELYGFDIMFDAAFSPWLLEANFSPALAVESEVDVAVKHPLIHDLVKTLNIPSFPTGHSAPPVEAIMRGKSRSAFSKKGTQSSPPPSAAPVMLVDSPQGKMKWLFPFNEETERLSLLATCPGQHEAALKSMLAEVKKCDARFCAMSKSFGDVYEAFCAKEA